MSADINLVCLTGRLVNDIAVRAAGKSNIVTGTIACNRTEKKDDGYKDIASFIDFQTWCSSEKQLSFYQDVFKKGAKVVLNGSLRQDSWEKDGQKRSKILIDVTKIEPMGASKGGASSDAGFPEA